MSQISQKSVKKVLKSVKNDNRLYCACCDYYASQKSHFRKHLNTKKHLKNGGAVIIFPAGAISLASNFFGNAEDSEWKTFAAKLAQVPNTTTIPFYFDGRNSLTYQMARRISVTLGYSLMFREICKKMGQTVSLQMRQPIQAETLSKYSNRTEITEYLRHCTYGQKGS